MPLLIKRQGSCTSCWQCIELGVTCDVTAAFTFTTLTNSRAPHTHTHTHPEVDRFPWGLETSNGNQADTSHLQCSTAHKEAAEHSAQIMLFKLLGWFLSLFLSLLHSFILYNIFLLFTHFSSLHFLLSFHRENMFFILSELSSSLSLLFTICFLIVFFLTLCLFLYSGSFSYIFAFDFFLCLPALFYLLVCLNFFFHSHPNISL
jgi:hypothetical protein